MIRKLNIALAGLLLGSLASSAQEIHVTANIDGLKNEKVYIHYYRDTVAVTDSVTATDGKFSWTAKMPEPQKVYMMLPTRYEQFFAESGDITITGTADGKVFKVKGSKIQDESDAYAASIKDLTDQEEAIYPGWGKGTKEDQAAREKKLDDLRTQKRARANAYISAHPGSVYSISLVSDRGMMGEYNDVNGLYQKLTPDAQQSRGGQAIAKRLVLLKRSALGEKVLEFTQGDTLGTPVQFAAFKGKYVLVDFWASWCGPCRAENPNVLKAYNEYKDKNFTVIGISLDDKGDNWKKAIRDDKMPWAELSDLKGWKNELADYYGIQGIPSNLLIDPNGKIIAKDLRGEALHEKLAGLLN